MFCNHCGREIAEQSNYCSICGARQRLSATHRQLTLSATDSKIAGVCGGIAEYLDVDPTVVRLIWLVLSVVPGAIVLGVLAYVLAWVIIPKAPGHTPSTASAAPVPPVQ
ncbi:MAG: PspC domain-containing protein [Candidatus Acidiferrales bacterium]